MARSRMIARQARVSVAAMRRWEPHDPGRSCRLHVITHYVTNQPNSQNDGALGPAQGSSPRPSTKGASFKPLTSWVWAEVLVEPAGPVSGSGFLASSVRPSSARG
jgi:hypothetical protein